MSKKIHNANTNNNPKTRPACSLPCVDKFPPVGLICVKN